MLSADFHQHLNSAALQGQHHIEYETLFRICPIVVSAPALLRWSPTYAVGPGGIGLSSKLPVRLFIGIEPTTNGGIQWGTIRSYLPEQNTFQTIESSRITSLVLEVLQASAKRARKVINVRIHVLSEIPLFRGLNDHPLLATPLAIAWLLMLGTITPEQVETIVIAPTVTITECPGFNDIWRLALQLDSVIAAWIADGDLVISSLLDARYPVMFYRERDTVLFDHYRDLGLDHPASYYNIASTLFFRAARMEEMFALDQFPSWPIDVALVYVGEEGSSDMVYKSRKVMKAYLDEVAAFTRTQLIQLTPSVFRETPRILEHTRDDLLADSAGINMIRAYRETSVAHSMVVFKMMHDLFQFGTDPQVFEQFTKAQDTCQYIMCMLGLSRRQIGTPRKILRLAGLRHTENGVSARLIGPGLHGCLMVVGPLNSLENVLNDALPRITEVTGKPTHCHWASWCDGHGVSAGVRLEQNVSAGKYAPWTSEGSITVHEGSAQKNASSMLYTNGRWETACQEFDLIFDEREKRIFVRGQALTSAEIHSAKQTIAVFRELLASANGELEAAKLNGSCYRNDRNQMESKIIRPLIAAVKTHTGKALGLEIHGGLGSNYSICFHPPANLRVGLIEKNK